MKAALVGANNVATSFSSLSASARPAAVAISTKVDNSGVAIAAAATLGKPPVVGVAGEGVLAVGGALVATVPGVVGGTGISTTVSTTTGTAYKREEIRKGSSLCLEK